MEPPSFNNTETRCVPFYEHQIFTTVTNNPSSVTAWIYETENVLRSLDHAGRLVGLDIEWLPNFVPGVENKVAIIQLCVLNQCLIFKIIHSPYIPDSLVNFLNNPSYTFTGVGIDNDVEKLVRHYGIGRGAAWASLAENVLDLQWLAKKVYGYNTKYLGLKRLARDVLRKEPEKPKHVTLSRWDDQWLTPEQVEYASIDAFLSFEIARVLVNLANLEEF